MKPNLRIVGALMGCAVLALLPTACGKRQHAPPARPPAAVRTAPAQVLDAPILIDAFGSTKDAASVDIVAQVSGLLVQTHITDGSVVTNGQALFQIDPRDYEAQVRKAEGLLAADRANCDLSRSTLERNRALLAKDLISAEDIDILETKVAAAEAQVRVDEATLDQARLNLQRCAIAAPLAGACAMRFVNDGNLVTAGLTRLTNIRSYDPIYVDVALSDEHLPRIRAALAQGPVRITITPRGSTNNVAGLLDSIDNAVSTQTGTIMLRGQAPNPNLTLWAGQYVDVRIYAGIVLGAVMVPEGAIQYGKQGPYLFVAGTNGTAELRPIAMGVRFDNLIQIVAGVAADEKVVVLGQLMLFPGAPVAEAAPDHAGPPSAPAGGATAPAK